MTGKDILFTATLVIGLTVFYGLLLGVVVHNSNKVLIGAPPGMPLVQEK